MPTVLTSLKINEVSSVDRGAGEGVRVVLMKRDDAAEAQIDAYMKRKFTAEQRQHAEASGAAMPGGGYPIENKDDLHNAIQAIGRAKDPEATRRHIMSRARALGASDAIPDTWKGGKLADLEASAALLKKSVDSIMGDASLSTAQKQEHLDETHKQFNEHVSGHAPEAIAKAIVAAGLVAKSDEPGTGKESVMAEKTDKEKFDDKEMECKKLQDQLAFANLPDAHKAFAIAKGFNDEQRFAFAKKDPKDREADMDADDKAKKAEIEKAMSPELVAKIAKYDAMEADLAAMKKRDELATFGKKADDMGLPGKGDLLQKAYGGDKAALDELCNMLKAAVQQVQTAGLFREFGSKVGKADEGQTAYEKIVAKGEELRKADPKLTAHQAFAKAYQDPANADLVKQHKEETAPRMVAA